MATHVTSNRWWSDAEEDPTHQTAAEWFTRIQEPDLSIEQTVAWQEWMAADPRHAEAFRRIEEVWQLAGAVEDRGGPGDADYDSRASIGGWLKKRAARRRTYVLTALAATLVCGLVGGAWLLTGTRGQLLETSIGQDRTLQLADGSRLELGGNTTVRVRVTNTLRHVELVRGEAFVNVAKDVVRPFEMQAGKTKVTAVGTAFDVRRGSDRVVVAVIEGRVRIAYDESTDSLAVDAGQETVVANSSKNTAVRLTRTAPSSAWQSGQLSFDAEPLRYALEDVNRYSRKPIVVGDASVGELLVSGSMHNDNIDGWIKSLESAFALEAIQEKQRIVLKRVRPEPRAGQPPP